MATAPTTPTPTAPGPRPGADLSAPASPAPAPPVPAPGPTPTVQPPANTVAPTTPMFGSQEQADAYTLLKAKFDSYGLGALVPQIIDFIKQGYSGDTIALMLRDTDAYKQRFPAMAELQKQGRAIQEIDYINYERNAAQLETRYGVPAGMATSPEAISRLMIANVSAEDLAGRFALNAAASMDAPPELKSTLRDYFGLDQGALTAYYLDPDNSIDLLQQQMASAKIGAAARRQSLSLGLNDAQSLALKGITDAQADQGFQQVAALTGLESGMGETASQGDIVAGVFGNAEAAQKVERVQRSRAAQFQAGGGAAESNTGITGLGR